MGMQEPEVGVSTEDTLFLGLWLLQGDLNLDLDISICSCQVATPVKDASY